MQEAPSASTGGPEINETLLGTSGERDRSVEQEERDSRLRGEHDSLVRGRRRMRGKRNLLDILPSLQNNALAAIFTVVVIVLLLSWTGYMYHLGYHRFFGNFTPHEKYICREEPLMLSMQKLMLQKARKEVAYMARSNTAANRINNVAKASAVRNFQPAPASFSESDVKAAETLEAERIKQAQMDLRLQHADTKGPSHPRPNVLDHRQQSKMKGLQLDKDPSTQHPQSRVFVSSDLGFYQVSYGAVHVETETGSTLIGQSVGTHAKVGNGFSTIVYYRIFKNANDYIRGMLAQFSRKKELRDGTKPICADLKECRHLPEKHMGSAQKVKSFFFPAHLRRYPFTFVRNPLSRFVSAYTEVEYRYKDAQTEREWWEAHHKDKSDVTEKDFVSTSRHSEISTEQSIDTAKRAKAHAHKTRQAKVLSTARTSSKQGAKQARVIHRSKKIMEYDRFGEKFGPHAHLSRKNLPLKAPLGSSKRVLEFIDMILLFEGSRRIFSTYDRSSELTHIAPQIGTLFAAHEHESLPIRTYQLESFSDNWKMLAEETAQPRLLQVRDVLKNHTGLWQHRSSADEHGTSKAAWSMFNVGINITLDTLRLAEAREVDRQVAKRLEQEERQKARQRLGLVDEEIKSGDVQPMRNGFRSTGVFEGGAVNIDDAARAGQRRVADTVDVTGYPMWLTLPQYLVPEVVYTRALCRIYLADFVCGDYALPAVCHDIVEEMDTFTIEYENKQREKAWASRSLAQSFLPQWLLYIIAEVPCTLLADSPPSCIAAFVHGESLDEEDEYDEWGDDHDEL